MADQFLGDEASRLDTELLLLSAAYPEQTTYNTHTRELKFAESGGHRCELCLRIPDTYPEMGLPVVVTAKGAVGRDLSERMRREVRGLEEGEEVLDVVVGVFRGLVEEREGEAEPDRDVDEQVSGNTHLTVVIWLHHLLATSKRKLALASPADVSGVTKPGYPGVMVFGGSAQAVREHLERLKQENWQAFQVRLEEDEVWEFEHGKGVKEVETMGEVVKAVGERKALFLEAMKIK